jgi:small-conductance mechanosensitive channel
MEFGNSSLNFELRVWIPDIEKRFLVRSDIHKEIDRRFREARVEIAFPQRDLHLRTVDERAQGALGAIVHPAPKAEEETVPAER